MIRNYFSSLITLTEKKKRRIKKIIASDEVSPE